MSQVPTEIWSNLSADFYGPLNDGSYLLVVIDDSSRYPICRRVSSTAWNKVLPVLNGIFSEFGIPTKLRTDNGPPFNSSKFTEFAQAQGFHHQKVTPRHAQANGLAERFMRSLGKVLRCAPSASFDDELNEFLRNYRATPHASTKTAPAKLMFQYGDKTSRLPTNNKTQPTAILLDAQANDEAARSKMKLYNDTKRRAAEPTLKVGDLILLKNERRLKADPLFEPRPFTIIKMNGTIKRDKQTLARNTAMVKLYEPSKWWSINDEIPATVQAAPAAPVEATQTEGALPEAEPLATETTITTITEPEATTATVAPTAADQTPGESEYNTAESEHGDEEVDQAVETTGKAAPAAGELRRSTRAKRKPNRFADEYGKRRAASR
jgi:hypothetical protein